MTPAPASGGKNVVVIFEDNPSIGQLLQIFFEKRGYDARLFEDGADAARRVREHAPVLIMMDMIMPGVDGIAACRDIRLGGITTPILMLTSKAFESDRESALAAGATGYLLKPLNPAALEDAIKPLLSA